MSAQNSDTNEEQTAAPKGGDSSHENGTDSVSMSKQKTDKEAEKQRHKDEMERMSKSMSFTNFINKRPYVILVIILVIVAITLSLTISREYMKTTEEGGAGYMAKNNIRAQQYWGMMTAFDEIESDNQAISTPLQSQEMHRWDLVLQFKVDEKTIFTKDIINKIKEKEKEFGELKNIDRFCMLDNGGKCKIPTSSSPIFDNLTTQPEIDTKVSEMVKDPNLWFFLSDETTENEPYSPITRAFYSFASPIEWGGKRYKDRSDDKAGQDVIFGEEFALDAYDWAHDTDGEDLEIYILGHTLIGNAIMAVFNRDLNFAILSIILVWVYTSIHLKSVFLSSFGMMQVVFIFPISLFIYKDVCQIIYFSLLQMLVIFILLGISADNFFIFNDAWTQALAFPKLREDMDRRMAFTYRRAVRAIIVTSGTTAIAFLSTCFSALMPIASFGVWAAMCVSVNFVLTITMFPCMLTIHERYIKYRCCTSYQCYKYLCCCMCANKVKQMEKDAEEDEEMKNSQPGPVPIQRKSSSAHKKGSTVIENQTSYGVIERFFDEKWAVWVNKAKYPILALFVVWICMNIYFTSQIKALTENEKWLPDDHYVQRSMDLSTKYQMGGEDTSFSVSLLWGVTTLNDEGTNYWDAQDIGKPEWDDDFDILSGDVEAKQNRFIEICEILRNSSLVMKGDDAVKCFMEDFRDWVVINGDTFPVPAAQFFNKFINFTVSDEKGIILRKEYYIGIGKEEGNEKIKLLRIKAESSAEDIEHPDYLYPIYEDWEDLKDSINPNNPEGMNKMLEVCQDWAWLDTFQEFIRSAVQGMLIAITFAFIILVVSTLNIIVAGYATLSVAGIIVCVMGVMQLADWKFGITESISCVILIGFSVDYVVHLAAHYCESKQTSRYAKMQESLKQIGISIFGGAITTLLAGFALFFCTVIFYTKFAILITSSICYSFGFSLLFFTALCFAVGPTGNCGDLHPLLAKLKNACCPKKEAKVVSSPTNSNNK